MPIDRARVRDQLISDMTRLLVQGVWVEDFIDALLVAVRQRARKAQDKPVSRRRAELTLFYADAGNILSDATRELGAAGVSAKKNSNR